MTVLVDRPQTHGLKEGEEVVEALPLPTVPDWDTQVREGQKLARIIDGHLDYEARGRMLLDLDDFRPEHLCPEQREQMALDLLAARS